MRGRIAMAAAGALLLAAAIWWARPDAPGAVSAPAVPTPAVSAPAVSTPAAPAVPAALTAPAPLAAQPMADEATMRLQVTAGPPEGEFGVPFVLGNEIDDLHARAVAGDPVAMRVMGRALHECRARWQDPDGEALHAQLQSELDGNASHGARADLDEQSYLRYERAMITHVDCLSLGRERADTGLGWLERAARTGDVDAKVAYALMALDKNAYADEGALYANLDEVIRRRDLMRGWVRDAIASGDRRALGDIAQNGETTVSDARERAVYFLAWSLVLQRDFGSSSSARQVQGSLDRDTYARMGQDWARDDAAWATFEDEARRIADRTDPLPPEQRQWRRPTGD